MPWRLHHLALSFSLLGVPDPQDDNDIGTGGRGFGLALVLSHEDKQEAKRKAKEEAERAEKRARVEAEVAELPTSLKIDRFLGGRESPPGNLPCLPPFPLPTRIRTLPLPPA